MKLLVAGGCGFTGNNFVHCTLDKLPGYQIVNLDKFTYAGNAANLKDVEDNRNYSFLQEDICDSQIVNQIVKETDYVAHFAAESHVDRSIEDGSVSVRTNVLGKNTLLQSALAHNIKKFVHVSSDKVYGSVMEGSFTETDNINPSSLYSSCKAGYDLLTIGFMLKIRKARFLLFSQGQQTGENKLET